MSYCNRCAELEAQLASAEVSICHCGCIERTGDGSCSRCGNGTFVVITSENLPELLSQWRDKWRNELGTFKLSRQPRGVKP